MASETQEARAADPMESRERRLHQIEMIVEAIEPIAHGAETVGNAQIAMRSKVRLPTGRFVEVPVVTGDTMRHGLREAATEELLRVAGLRGGLSEAALRLLYNGGLVRGAAKDVVSIAEARELEELLPHLGLLGGCVGNRIVPGKVECGYMHLVCSETEHMLPTWVGAWLEEQGTATAHAVEHVEEVQRVKMDALLNPHTRRALSPEAQEDVDARMLASDSATAAGDAKGKKTTRSSMMPFTYETIVRGSIFYWRLNVTTDTAIERDALAVMIAAFFSRAKVGGKKGTGHGAIRPLVVRGHEKIITHETEGAPLAIEGEATYAAVERYVAHVKDRASRIEEFLSKVVA